MLRACWRAGESGAATVFIVLLEVCSCTSRVGFWAWVVASCAKSGRELGGSDKIFYGCLIFPPPIYTIQIMSTRFNKIYQKLIRSILSRGQTQTDKRLFHKKQPKNKVYTKIRLGFKFKLDIKEHGLPVLSLRKIPIKLFIAELIWFLLGDNNPNGVIRQYTRIWDDFIEEDGTVTSYGHRWKKWFGRDQLKGIVDMLKKDPTSRHAVLVTWDPGSDSLANGVKRMNVPCHVTSMFNILDGRLHMHSIWRSQDAYLGFPHDVAAQSLLLILMAKHLGLEPGVYHHYTANIHLYNNQFEPAQKLLQADVFHPKIQLDVKPDWLFPTQKQAPGIIENLIEQISRQYKPSLKIKQVKIIV